MPPQDQDDSQNEVKGGFASGHPAAESFPILVAPATGKEKNIIRMELIPVACWKLNDVRFAFGSSFVLPETRSEFIELSQLRKQHAGAPLSVFGHADPVDDDVFNKALSGNRAESIYAVLIRDAARWEKLYSAGGQAEGWGTSSIQHMLNAIGQDAGPVTGTKTAQTTDAVKAFQTQVGLTVDGDPGPKTREKLFLAYMDFLCPEKLQKTDFLARGADKEGKGDYQGCSEFNPVMVFSQAENTEFSKEQNKSKRNEENGVNRRVMVLLFRPGTTVPVAKWPCPRADEGISGCKKRFWSNGDQRRSPQALRRKFGETQDTFGCRFYHRMVVSSPCEGVDPNILQLFKLLKVDDHFCPKQEKLDIVYTLKGFSGKPVRLQISSAHSKENPIFEKELAPNEKSDGDHTFQWDGKSTAATGEFKDGFIHPLFSPYKVTLVHDAVFTDSMEFKVLYHSVELKQGPWTPDEEEPADDKKFVALKLNELGYYGGPVEKDFDDYLKKAIIRYKANHQKFHKKFIGDYDDSIDDDLKAALKAKEGDRKVPALTAIPDKTAKSIVPVEALTYERTGDSADEFGTTRPPHEKLRLNRPLIPVEAIVFLKKKDDSKVLEPEAVGPARITWRAADANEDLTPQFENKAAEPSETKKFIEKALQQHGGRTGTNGDNCPQEFAGIREDGDPNYKTPFLIGDHYVPHDLKDDAGNKAVFSLACVDKAKFPKRQGKAGVFLRPSYIAGDDYKLFAELDFTGLANKADLEKFHGIKDESTKIKAETGTFTVRRFNNVAVSIEWPGRKSPLAAAAKVHLDYEWDKIGVEFDKAFNDLDTANIASKKLSDIITEAEYKDLVAANTPHTDQSKIKLLDECMIGVDIPAQGARNADDYKAFLSTFAHTDYNQRIQTPLGNLLSEKIRKTLPTGFIVVNFLSHKPIDIQTDPANGDTAVLAANKDYVNWSGSIGLPDSIVIADMKDPDKVYYVISHEMGHNFYLLHWENTGENNLANHDQNDHNCSMSYSTSGGPAHQAPGTYTPHFCGKCNLALRGWDVTSANLADKSKVKGGSTVDTKEVDPGIKVDKPVVVVKTNWTNPERRPVTLTVSKTFGGTATLTRNHDNIKFFDKKTGGKEIKFKGGDNIFFASKLTGKGLTLFAESNFPSLSADECELTLTLAGGPEKIGPKNPAKVKLTAVQVNMGIRSESDTGSGLWDEEKVNTGAIAVVGEKDFSHQRAILMVGQVLPYDFKCTLRVESIGSKLAAFKQQAPATKQKNVALPIDIDSSKIPDHPLSPKIFPFFGWQEFYIEGSGVSGALRDHGYRLSIKGIEQEADLVKLTLHSDFHLHVDANRDGKPDDDHKGIDKWEWGKGKKGAILLCNSDDDGGLSAADHSDSEVNAGNDEDELAPILIKRKGGPDPPTNWEIELSMSAADAGRVRLFRERKTAAKEILGKSKGASFKFPNLKFTEKELGMEATRHAGPGFNGELELIMKVKKGGKLAYEEKAAFRVAPWLMPTHLDQAEKVFVAESPVNRAGVASDNSAFVSTLESFVTGAGCTLFKHSSSDTWMQDCMEWGFASLPNHGFRAVVRLPRGRPLHALPLTFRDVDLGATSQGTAMTTADEGSTFNSGGNVECTPAVKSKAGKQYPFGRIYFGKGTRPGEEIDKDYTDFLKAQVVQDPIEIDTDWLAVGHVDEIISIVPAPTSKKFKVVLASPRLAYKILDDNEKKHGSSKMLIGREFEHPTWKSAEVTISDFLSTGVLGKSGAGLRAYNLTTAGQTQKALDTLKAQFKTELGLSDSDFIELPVIFISLAFPPFADALTAGIVNMLVTNKRCLVPDPFGPVVGGVDLFQKVVLDELKPLGLKVEFIDDWYEYHVQMGEVHCGTNTLRTPAKAKWWEFEP